MTCPPPLVRSGCESYRRASARRPTAVMTAASRFLATCGEHPYGGHMRIALALLVPLALGAGCITPAQNRKDALVRIVPEYNDGLRWKRYERVTAHLAEAEALRFLKASAVLGEDFEMADEEVVVIEPVGDDGLRAAVTVNFSWYNQRRALLRKAVVLEDWRFRDGRWLCDGQRRVRGDGFPLFSEGDPPPKLEPAAL